MKCFTQENISCCSFVHKPYYFPRGSLGLLCVYLVVWVFCFVHVFSRSVSALPHFALYQTGWSSKYSVSIVKLLPEIVTV